MHTVLWIRTEECCALAVSKLGSRMLELSLTSSLTKDAKAELSARGGFEIIAEQLRLAQQSLGEITGTVSTEDLLGEIFGSFCIGK